MYSAARIRGFGRFRSGGDSAAAVRALFAAGEQGAWYDPSDLSSMYQDSAGTTAAVVGQPVGKILDKSGRGNHATQATSASRPTLQQDASGYYYLSFDGFDDGMATAAINFSATDKMTVWAGVNKQSDAAVGLVAEFTADLTANAGSWYLAAPISAATANFAFASKGTVAAQATATSIYAAPFAAVITGQGNISGDSVTQRVNGVLNGSTLTDEGTGNYANAPLYLGRRGGASLPFNGRIYSLIVRGAASDTAQISAGERYAAGKQGVVLA